MQLGNLKIGEKFMFGGDLYKAYRCTGDNFVLCVNLRTKRTRKISVFAEIEVNHEAYNS